MIFEIRSRGQSKGEAVRRLMQLPTFAGRKPLFVGDDRTDLDGIRAAVELGGSGIAVAGLQAIGASWALHDSRCSAGLAQEPARLGRGALAGVQRIEETVRPGREGRCAGARS